ncbi:MAG: hypothetical protein K5657_01630 [Desulfovibrio sp.]|nr:hypothetical protein [Desulfovibrio sp.]
MNLALLKYVKSFSDGRVRIRHPALHSEGTAKTAQQEMQKTHGVERVDYNTVSGSLLILYDSDILSKDQLIAMGEAWAAYLNAVQQKKEASPPVFA